MEKIVATIALGAPGFLLAIVCHEAAHAYVALKFGDDTGERMGRISLNPVVHADPIGSLVFPLVLVLMGSAPFGWAKPVPVQPGRFRNIKWGIFWTSFAGPLANIALCILSALFYAIMMLFVPESFGLKGPFMSMLNFSCTINAILALFNLLPLPSFDGGQMLQTFMSYNAAQKFAEFGRYSFMLLIILMFTGLLGNFLMPAYIFAGGMQKLFLVLFGMTLI